MKYFHQSTMARRRRNHILALKNSNGEWVHEADDIKQMVQEFFISLYCEELDVSRGFPSVSQYDWQMIHSPIFVEEIKATLFSMGPLKAPFPDGLHAVFFQSQWEVVGESLCTLV